MTANATTWIRRAASCAVLAAAPALIALGTAASSQADTTSISPSYSPAPHGQMSPYPYGPGYGSFHDRHAADIQSWYR